jgi:hypothetical protein
MADAAGCGMHPAGQNRCSAPIRGDHAEHGKELDRSRKPKWTAWTSATQ